MKFLIATITCSIALSAAALLAWPGSGLSAEASRSELVRSRGKAVAAIAVETTLSARPAVGVPLRMRLAFSARPGASLALEVSGPPELGFARLPLRYRIASGQPLVLDFEPQREGRFYVNVIAREAGSAGPAKAMSIPVQVGEPRARASKAVRSATGELLIRMPAD